MSKKTIIGILILGLFIGTALLSGMTWDVGHVSLKGIVTDSQGSVLPGVKIIAINTATNVQYDTLSDSEGRFLFQELPAGFYDIKVGMAGFKTVLRKRIRIVEAKTVTLEFKLKMLGSLEDITLVVLEEDKNGRVLGGVVGEVAGGVRKKQAYWQPVSPYPSAYPKHNTEEYNRIYENIYLDALNNPLSTFSIDVDTASYANIRRFIKNNQFPLKDAVRIEEMINYFSYDYLSPKKKSPFSINTEISSCPWNQEHRLVHIGLQGKKLETKELPPSNLVFLLDVSGSMQSPNKLPLLRTAFKLLVRELGENDRVSIAVYAGAAGLVLPSTSARQKDKIIEAIDKLRAGGSTAGGAGIKLAYKVAEDNFIENGNNRIILATDGDFNIGVSSTSALVRLVEEKRKKGIFLTTLGFGMGNYKDGRMEQLADKGNGNYYYIDNLLEAKKVFIDDMRGTLFTIAKDVKIQIEFNPAKVKAYRLIGYENRMLKKEDFADDTKDAGELGAGHTVTALYEIIPYGSKEEIPGIDKLKYQETAISPQAFKSKELMTVKLRYKEPDGEKSKLIEHPLVDKHIKLTAASENFKFSAAVAAFGMLLRDSDFKGDSNFESVLKLAREGKGKDFHGYRAEFITLVEMCSLLKDINK